MKKLNSLVLVLFLRWEFETSELVYVTWIVSKQLDFDWLLADELLGAITQKCRITKFLPIRKTLSNETDEVPELKPVTLSNF